MGGTGSGNWWRWDSRPSTEGVRRLDVRQLRRRLTLRPGFRYLWRWSDGGSVRIAVADLDAGDGRAWMLTLDYRHRAGGWGEWEDVQQTVLLDWTECNYGGARPWFRCPGCYGRVAVLWGAGRYFLCRQCYNLAYASTRETPHGRQLSKAQAIRRTLGGEANLLAPFPDKPKGMHWRTYMRLRRQARTAELAYDLALAARLEALNGFLACHERAP